MTVAITAMMSDVKIFCQINPLMISQLFVTVAPSAGINALIKIIINGMITSIKETSENGISKTQLRLPDEERNTL
jgi:hypothetical protein